VVEISIGSAGLSGGSASLSSRLASVQRVSLVAAFRSLVGSVWERPSAFLSPVPTEIIL